MWKAELPPSAIMRELTEDRIEAVLSAGSFRRRLNRLGAELRLRASLSLRRSKVQVMQSGVAAGARFCPGPSNPDYGLGSNELPVQEAIKELLEPGDVFYDIGANVGFFTIVAAGLVGPSGTMVAFEPLPRNFVHLRFNCSLNDLHNVTCVEAAVGSATRNEKLLVAEYSGGSALESADTPPDVVGSLGVAMVALDDWVASGRGPTPDVVKIDVEGAELDVLKGMQAILARKRVSIVLETDGPDVAAVEQKTSACRDLLQRLGYRTRALPESYPGNRWLVRHFVAEAVTR